MIGIGVVGLGRAGMIHARIFSGGIARARLVAVADPSAEARELAARELGGIACHASWPSLLEDRHIQAVVVATPTVLHRDIVVAALQAGKHVLCEKPMAMQVSDCEQMIYAAASGSARLQIGFMRRFDRSFAEARRLVSEGAIGQVVQVKSLTHGPSRPQPWMYDIQASNGPLAEVNSHDIDTLRWFTGSEFVEVHAMAGNYRCPEAREKYPDFYDTVLMNARFANGMQGSIDGAVSVSYGYDARLEVLGTAGILFAGDLPDTSVRICTPDSKLVRSVSKSWRDLFAEAYLEEDRSFVASIKEGREPVVTGKDGLEAVRVVRAGNLSISSGRSVRLEEV